MLSNRAIIQNFQNIILAEQKPELINMQSTMEN